MHLQFLCLSHTPSVGSKPLTLLWLSFQLSLSFSPGPCSNNAQYILVPWALCSHCWYKVDKSRNSFFFLIDAPIVSALTAKNEGCIFLPYLNVCYNGVPNSKHLHIILVLEVTMTCSFAFSVWLVLCEALGLTLLFDVCAKDTFLCLCMYFFLHFEETVIYSHTKEPFLLNEQFAVTLKVNCNFVDEMGRKISYLHYIKLPIELTQDVKDI